MLAISRSVNSGAALDGSGAILPCMQVHAYRSAARSGKEYFTHIQLPAPIWWFLPEGKYY